jgi:hypothetical protein
MKRQLIAGATALALAAGMTTTALAFDHDRSGFRSSRFEGVRGFSSWRHGDWGSRRFVEGYGPLHDGNYGVEGPGPASYCPAFSRCGAGLP